MDFCLTLPCAYEDYPFDDIVGAGAWTVMRHSVNKRGFAHIYERYDKLCINLKCEPLEADFLRSVYEDVTPGYHMNKQHWNTITIGGDVPDDALCGMIEKSYNLINPKVSRKKAGEWES